jgi:hypothetical protein
MKQPRRPTKKTARKIVRKKRQTKAQKAAQDEARLRASLRQVDPYYLHPSLIPVGWAYQWKIEGASPRAGWSCVPFSRHAHDFPREYQNLFGQIAFCGLVLMEALKDQVASEGFEPHRQAQQMSDEHPASNGGGGRREGTRFQIMSSDWVASGKIPSEAYQNEGEPVQVPVTLMMSVPVRWRSAAMFLGLTLTEYARRRIVMEHLVLRSIGVGVPPEVVYAPNKPEEET